VEEAMPRVRRTARRGRGDEPVWRGAPDRQPDAVREHIGPERVDLLWQADRAMRATVAGQLQRQSGNRFVQALLQRQPTPAPLTDAQQWEQDWNTYSAQQSRFAASGRPAGTPRERYDILCPLYKAHGIPRPMVYMATSITTASFFQFKTPAHSRLATALANAETALKAKGHTSAPVTSVWALNPRTTSAGGWSNHADGKAVDIDPDHNPHIVSKDERKVISLVTGADMEKGSQGFDVMKGVSDRFKADYNPAGMQRRITELTAAEKTKETARDTAKSERDTLKGQGVTLTAEIKTLKKDLQAVPKGKKATPADATKATDLKAAIQQKETNLKQVQTELKLKEGDLKKKEAELKQAAKDRELLEKQLASYQATETAIAELEASVKALPADIKKLEDQITTAKQDEADAKAAKNKDGVRAQQTLQAKLNQALTKTKANLKKSQTKLAEKKKARDDDPLRQYAAGGILNLPKDIVEAMTGAGLSWGGNWDGAKDFMHFEL
jgi:D-alanyl-D-alanine carboxypeptidase-like protein